MQLRRKNADFFLKKLFFRFVLFDLNCLKVIFEPALKGRFASRFKRLWLKKLLSAQLMLGKLNKMPLASQSLCDQIWAGVSPHVICHCHCYCHIHSTACSLGWSSLNLFFPLAVFTKAFVNCAHPSDVSLQ